MLHRHEISALSQAADYDAINRIFHIAKCSNFAYKAYGKLFKFRNYTIKQMEERKLLIVGIDPGTTTAYAVLGIEGNLIHLDSSKQLDLKLLISETISHGKAVLVGTDKAKVPNLVESFATKLGARIVSPQEDLKVDEKREMVSNFNFGDEHQGDALASALFAYKETKALLDKINFFAVSYNVLLSRNDYS
jgi:predicted RNase H-like nuclease (RuvC/YqgF family)